MLGSVAKVSEVCLLLLWPCLALLVLAPSVAPRPALPDEESLRPRKSVFTASSEFSTRAKSDTAPTWAGSQHSNKASWENEKSIQQHQKTGSNIFSVTISYECMFQTLTLDSLADIADM